jgi:hypothetical protein
LTSPPDAAKPYRTGERRTGIPTTFATPPSTERIGRSDQPEALEAVQELADAGGRDSELSRKVKLVD